MDRVRGGEGAGPWRGARRGGAGGEREGEAMVDGWKREVRGRNESERGRDESARQRKECERREEQRARSGGASGRSLVQLVFVAVLVLLLLRRREKRW
jgi:hypothetical protein